jgi:hypothetical protein
MLPIHLGYDQNQSEFVPLESSCSNITIPPEPVALVAPGRGWIKIDFILEGRFAVGSPIVLCLDGFANIVNN